MENNVLEFKTYFNNFCIRDIFFHRCYMFHCMESTEYVLNKIINQKYNFTKKETSKTNYKKLRPISLANCLLKVVSHTLLLRLESAIEEGGILSPNFFAYRKGRCSVEMGMSLLQTLNSAHHKNEKLAGVSINLEGAFENCSRVI